MVWKRLGAFAGVVGATLALIVGVAALKWYIWDVAIQQADEPDRSMLFWGIPIAFIGVAALAVAIALGAVTYRHFRGRITDDPEPKDL
jgi:hypothetical protein